ncbi:hypothetical protein TRVL_02476 [Trypanosoma vivax]|nr:hypothetical protein TRVL_02476 [Trypanosoma vivax]
MEDARAWVCSLSSRDLEEARQARLSLARLMEPQQLIEMWRAGKQRDAAELLREAEEVGNPDVYAAIGENFRLMFCVNDKRALAEQFLQLDDSHIVVQFLLNGISHEDISRAGSLCAPLLGLLSALPPHQAAAVGHLVSSSLKNEKVLRLFDVGSPDCAENKEVCRFLHMHTDLVPFIASATVDAFDSDPLLVANYLDVCGVMMRHVELPVPLFDRILRELTEGADSFVFPFTCRACSLTIRHHEQNASKFARQWTHASAAHLVRCSHDTRDAIYDLLGAASSTATGWLCSQMLVNAEDMTATLSSSAARSITLGFLCDLVQSPHVPDAFFSSSLLGAIWQLRYTQDDLARERLWIFLTRGFWRPAVVTAMAASCASFLCSDHQEVSVVVRQMQLQLAAQFAESPDLVPEMAGRLREFVARGLYPPSSVGVAAIPRR